MVAVAVSKPKAIDKVIRVKKSPHEGRHRLQGKWW